jgi:hypothetical protein
VFNDYKAMGPLEDDEDFTNHKTMNTIEDDEDSASINLEDIELSVKSCMNCKHEQIELRVAEQDSVNHGRKWSFEKKGGQIDYNTLCINCFKYLTRSAKDYEKGEFVSQCFMYQAL